MSDALDDWEQADEDDVKEKKKKNGYSSFLWRK